MSKKKSISLKYEDTSFKKIYISPYNLMKKKLNPYRITKRINDMKFHVDKIYNNFYNYSTDLKRQKQLEEYIQFKKMEKLRRINFIKNLGQYYKPKIDKETIFKSKSVQNFYDMKCLYSKIISTIKMQNKYENKYYPYLVPIKKEELIRLNCITEFGLIDTIKKIKENNLLKGKSKRMSVQKLKTLKSPNNANFIKRKSSTLFLMPKTNNDKKNAQNFFAEKNPRLISPSHTTRYDSAIGRNYGINTNKNNFRINSVDANSTNKNIFQNYNHFIKKEPYKYRKIRKISIKSLVDVKKAAYKILPLLSSSFNSTLKKSRDLKRQLNSFQKDSTMRSESSKKKKQKIIKKFFYEYKIPTIKSSLSSSKKKFLWTKNKSKYISENKNGTISLKFDLLRKEKSPLIFVEDYNKLRNRRRKNNKNIEKNLGLGVYSTKNERRIKTSHFLGMTFNDIRKVNT